MPVHPEPNEKEKKIINEKNTTDNKIICAVDKKPINTKSGIEYHNMKPQLIENHLLEKKPCVPNIVPVCKSHHKELGQLSVIELIAFKEMEQFFKKDGVRKLDDVLALKVGQDIKGIPLEYEINNDGASITIKFIKLNSIDVDNQEDLKTRPDEKIDPNKMPPEEKNNKEIPDSIIIPLSVCPSTGFKYFYAVLPLQYINNDIELQPRPLELKRLWDLYRHLLVNSQLTPSVCRLAGSKIYLFDGQHKAAAQIWAGRKEIECKIYIDPLIKTLKETNLVAHDKLRQMPFFTSVLINKWASIFTEEWKDFLEQPGKKSESSFVSFLAGRGKKKSEALHMIESNIYDSILEDEKNTLRKYLGEYNADFKNPLTVGRLKTSFLKKFISSPPLGIDIEQSDRLREVERKNMVRVLNLVVMYSLEGMWDPDSTSENHNIAERMYLNGSFKAVCATLKDVIATILELFDESERKEILLREISADYWDLIEKAIEMLFSHRIWADSSQENYNNLRMGNETLVRKYLSRRGLSVNWVLNNSFNSRNDFID